MLQGQKKKVLKDVVRYYGTTTGKSYEDFLLDIQKTRGNLALAQEYSEWLAAKIFEILQKNEITLADCIENKDVIRSSLKEDESRKDGEFYTPEVWAAEGREYLKRMLGDLWGKAYIWDASAGTGNLLRSSDYPRDKLFLSTILPEDVEILKASFPGAHVFRLDFVNDIDWDQNNRFFSNNLPPELVGVLERNEPIVFYMNPPYKVMEANSSDVGAYMASMGMAKCALDIFHQFIYRLIMIKRFYQLTNMYLGIFGPVTMFHSKMLEPLYNEFKSEFKFVDGMCFSAGDFANTSESVGWLVGYTTWRSKNGDEEDKSIVLDAKSVDEKGNISVIGKRLITSIDVNLHDWVKAKDIIRIDQPLPEVTTFMNFTGDLVNAPQNYLGYLMSSNFVIRATRRSSVTSLPNPDNVPITPENFWRCVASFAARRCYATKANPYNNSQYYSKPDETIEGYDQWLRDALVLFLFEHNSQQASYRDLEVGGYIWNIPNRLFPIPYEIVREVVSDPVILDDMTKFPPQNQFLVSILQQVQYGFSPDAMELYQYCLTLILESLQGDKRARFGYANWTKAWDAGFIQLKSIKGFFTPEQDEKYTYLLSKLRHKLYDGVYKYGFMMDTAFAVEDNPFEDDDEEVDEFEGVF